jgi:guanylate kinase
MSELKRGLLLVLSGPSGVGKGTVFKELKEHMPDLIYSVSATTRLPRAGEVEGVNYFFKTRAEFLQMVQQGDALLEHAEYVGNYYGTPRAFVEEMLDAGKDVILEIDVQGAAMVKEQMPEGIFMFMVPPSMESLQERIVGRGTEGADVIAVRMAEARKEMALVTMYDYVVVNDVPPAACQRIASIIIAEHCREARYIRD